MTVKAARKVLGRGVKVEASRILKAGRWVRWYEVVVKGRFIAGSTVAGIAILKAVKAVAPRKAANERAFLAAVAQ